MQLKSKTVIISGASEGIGRAISLRLAKERATLALVARNEENLKLVRRECLEAGANKAVVYATDLTNPQQTENTVEQIVKDMGTIDILINNSGVWQKLSTLDEISYETIEKVVATNLTGLINLTRLCLPHLKKSQEAAIINISSRSGVTAQAGQSVYSASKWGVTGFTEVLKEDLANSHIRVAGVYQSGTNTNLFKKAGENLSQDQTKKFTEPEDLADVVAYMLTRPNKLWMHDVRITH